MRLLSLLAKLLSGIDEAIDSRLMVVLINTVCFYLQVGSVSEVVIYFLDFFSALGVTAFGSLVLTLGTSTE